MANPNIVNVTDIRGNTASYVVTSSTPFATALISNPANSSKIFKINTIILSNRSGSINPAGAVLLYSQNNLGGTNTEIVSNVTIRIGASLVVISKEAPLYLLEDRSIGVSSSSANALTATASWEEIS